MEKSTELARLSGLARLTGLEPGQLTGHKKVYVENNIYGYVKCF